MVSFITASKAQQEIANNMRTLRLGKGLTQEGLAERSGVRLPTLRRFEQKGLISLESFLKLAMSLGVVENLVKAVEASAKEFSSIDDVLSNKKDKKRHRGWRK